MKTTIILAAMSLTSTLATSAQTMQTTQHGDTTVITITNPTKYLLLPIEENRPEAQVVLDQGKHARESQRGLEGRFGGGKR